jgi:hypothetical protein
MSDNTRLLYVKYSTVEADSCVCVLLSSAHKIYSIPPIHSRSCCAAIVISFLSSYLSRSPESKGRYFVLVMIIRSALEIMSLYWKIQVSPLST